MNHIQPPTPFGLGSLIADIEQSHHTFTRTQLEQIDAELARMGDVPAGLRQCIHALKEDLIPHLMKEEHILFPYITALEHSPEHPPAACFGSVANPIQMMQIEHEAVKSLLAELRQITTDYRTTNEPLAELYAALKALEEDLIEHIYQEDEVLFPLALRLEKESAA